jgi:integrase
MDLKEIENCLSVKTWLNGLKSNADLHSTKYHWLRQLKRFCEWVGKGPDQLIEERKAELKAEDERVRHTAETNLKAFLNHLEEEGKSPNTRKNYFMGVRNFYKRNYYPLTFFRGDGPSDETSQEGVRAANKDDINKMIEVSNPRVRALLLFLKDTGLAESDAAALKLGVLSESKMAQPIKEVSEVFALEPPVPIIVRRKKTKRLTITFMGKESFEALKTTLRVRQQGSPELMMRRYGKVERKAGLQPENLTLDSPLFRSYEKFFALKKLKIKHLSPGAISVIVRKAAISAGVWKEGFSAHALRRFFQTSLETAGTNQNWIKKMMGHALEGSEKPYSQPEVATLREAYQKAYSHLAVSEIAEQKSRVEQLEAQVESLQMNGHAKKSELDKQGDKIELLERQVGTLSTKLELSNEINKWRQEMAEARTHYYDPKADETMQEREKRILELQKKLEEKGEKIT